LAKIFNSQALDDPRVRYFSVAGRTGPLNVWHPLRLPKIVLDDANDREGNNGLGAPDNGKPQVWQASRFARLGFDDAGKGMAA